MFSKFSYMFIVDTSLIKLEALQTILTNNVVEHNTKTEYTLLNYDTNMVAQDDTIRGLYNAVVLHPVSRRILAIGPYKSYSISKFKHLYGDVIHNMNTIQVQQLVEGLFVQFFWDERIQSWEISTRNSVGGHYAYYRMPHEPAITYRDMLYDALGLSGENRSLNQWLGLTYLNKQFCYHFILQHPQNHIVFNHKKPLLYMIGAFELHVNGINNRIRYVPSSEYLSTFPEDNPWVHYPTIFTVEKGVDTVDKIIEHYTSIQSSSYNMGVLIKQIDTGDNIVALNPAYEELLKLRGGTHPNILYNYLCLKRVKKVKDFLLHFPQYKKLFWSFHELFESFLEKLHKSYVHHFILKTESKIHKKYYYHIQQLHKTIYIPSLQNSKVVIKKPVVRAYLDQLEPGYIFHMLQHELYENSPSGGIDSTIE